MIAKIEISISLVKEFKDIVTISEIVARKKIFFRVIFIKQTNNLTMYYTSECERKRNTR